MTHLPPINSRITVRTREVRGVGTVTEVCERWGYVRVTLDNRLRCSVRDGEWRAVEEPVEVVRRDEGRAKYHEMRRGRVAG